MSDESRVTSRGWRMAENMCHVDAGATVDADRLARVNMQPASGGRGLSLGEYPPPERITADAKPCKGVPWGRGLHHDRPARGLQSRQAAFSGVSLTSPIF